MKKLQKKKLIKKLEAKNAKLEQENKLLKAHHEIDQKSLGDANKK